MQERERRRRSRSKRLVTSLLVGRRANEGTHWTKLHPSPELWTCTVQLVPHGHTQREGGKSRRWRSLNGGGERFLFPLPTDEETGALRELGCYLLCLREMRTRKAAAQRERERGGNKIVKAEWGKKTTMTFSSARKKICLKLNRKWREREREPR